MSERHALGVSLVFYLLFWVLIGSIDPKYTITTALIVGIVGGFLTFLAIIPFIVAFHLSLKY